MLILPPGHARSIAGPRVRLARREWWMIGSLLALVAAGAVVLVIALTASGRSTGHGCIDVSVQAATGGSELYRCGAQARSLCASVRAAGSGSGESVLDEAIATQCRRAGLPVG